MSHIPKALNLSPYTSDEDVLLSHDSYNMIYLTGTSALNVRLPAIAACLSGWFLYVTNTSTELTTVRTSVADGGSVVATIDVNVTTLFVLNKTAGDDLDTWIVISFAAGGGGVGAQVNDLRITNNNNNTASTNSDYCIAIGATALADNSGSIAIGSASVGGENGGAYAGGEGAVAIGSATAVGGNGASALGIGSIAIGSAVNGILSGLQAANYSVAIGCSDSGSNTGALNQGCIAIGYNAVASADGSIYIGNGSGQENASPSSIAIGNNSSLTNGTNSISIGNNNILQTGDNQIAIGGTITSASDNTITLACQSHENSVAGQFRVVTAIETLRSGGPNVGGIAWFSALSITTTPAAAAYQGGLIMITSTTTISLPTGSAMDSAIDSPYIGMTFNCTLFPASGAVAITVAGNGTMTLYGPTAPGAGIPIILTFYRNEVGAWFVISK